MNSRILLIAACTASISTVAVSPATADDFQSHCQYLGEDPSGETTWSERVTGLAHDDTHWYVAQERALWRASVTVDLGTLGEGTPGVTHRTSFPELGLDASVAWAFGDPAAYRHNGVDYLLVRVSLQGFGDDYDTLAVFDARTLIGVAGALVSDRVGDACGVDSAGIVYLNQVDAAGNLERWSLDWNALQQDGTLLLTYLQTVTFREPNDAAIPFLPGMIRSLEFTPDGRYAYVLADDIHVFDGPTLRRRFQSRNSTGGFFPFAWVNSGPGDPEETPEGMCIWNLNGSGSPHDGQLHVIVRDWDGVLDADDVFLKHYSFQINVDGSAASAGNGSIATPYRTITQAAAASWYGAELRIRANVYDEAVRIDRHVRLTTIGGVTRIGG